MAEFFKRVEKKYELTTSEYLYVKRKIKEKMIEDEHGKSTILNIYFDSENYDLIRHSISKPVYKDKIRLRSYNTPKLDTNVFLEIKRKYEGVVSKRRINIKLKDFYNFLNLKNEGQVESELLYYFDLYNLREKMFLSYDRVAYYMKDDRNFRLTFDNNIIARNYDLNLESGVYGDYILDKDKYIMEVKTTGAIPLWFVEILNEIEAKPCNFSKYGEAYTKLILQNRNENKRFVV